MEILVRCSPNLVNHSFIYYVLISSTWQHGYVLQHILTLRKFENNVRTALRNVTNMKCEKSGLLLFCFVFLVIYRGFCEIIFSYACALTQWRISDQRDTVRRRGGRGALADEWEWGIVIVSSPSGQLWGLNPRPQPSILSSAAKSSWYVEDTDRLSALIISAVKPIHAIAIELCMPFMRRWDDSSLFQITALHQLFFFQYLPCMCFFFLVLMTLILFYSISYWSLSLYLCRRVLTNHKLQQLFSF